MKSIFFFAVLILGGQVLYAQQASCPKNPDSLYDRIKVQTKFVEALNDTYPNYSASFHLEDGRPYGFYLYDLTDPSNKSEYKNPCVDFFDGHVYHFSSLGFRYSKSFIAILTNGNVKIFKSINCGDIDKNLKEVISYVKKKLRKRKDLNDTLLRIANYRRYGLWLSRHGDLYNCEITSKIPEDTDKSYSRYDLFHKMRGALNSFNEYGDFRIFENERAIGFYIQDLVDLSNKQTNLLEHVDFKEGHVYQFGWIDAPYSVSHYVVLKDGKKHFFEGIECKSKKEGIDKFIGFIKENFKNKTERKKIIKRIKNYKKYRVAIKFEGKTEPQCNCPK